MDKNYLTITELNTYLKNIIDSEDLLHRICVVGEISGLSLRGQHAYFTLKDENSQLRCCCFNYKKTYVPRDGELILAFGSVDFYHKGGYLSFNIVRIEPYGDGLLAMKLEELKKKLLEKGYFDESRKKAIPSFCQNIGVITSKDGAVLHDIVRTIRSKNNVSNIDFFDVKVQGIGSAESIISTLERVDKLHYDVIIIARGGGSFEDLMSFNDERLVYAIFDAKTPIISAVGHETDTTLCDFVSDLRVPTPTAAGELFAYDISRYIDDIKGNIEYAYTLLIDKYNTLASTLRTDILELMSTMKEKESAKSSDLRVLNSELIHAINMQYDKATNRVKSNIDILNACNPARILEHGYIGIKDSNGKNIESITNLKVGDMVVLKGLDGEADAEIKNIREEKR